MFDDPRVMLFVDSLEHADIGTGDLVRFEANAGDDRVADLVQSTELYDDEARSTLRTLLTGNARDTLYLFAQRRVVLARRTLSANHLHQALAALSLLPTVNEIPWNTWFLAALWLGDFATDASVVDFFEGPKTAGGVRCRSLQRSLEKGGSLAQCHLVEVTTNYGVGLIELPVPRDVPASGWLNAPLIDRDDALYEPTMNLAQVAVDVADAMDRLENTRTGALQYSTLSSASTSLIPTLACLHFWVTSHTSTLDVYVAQLEADVDPEQLEATLHDDEGVVVYDGDVVALLREQPRFDELDAEPLTMGPFVEVAKSALARSAR